MPTIEQAKGILMARHGCGPDEAFDLLRRGSQQFNVPVRVLAARLVDGAERPGPQPAQVLDEALRGRAAPTLGALLEQVLEFALELLHAELARQHAQVIIADATTDPGFAPHREIALASGFRAVQSTPLVNRAGQLVGMLSTHYPGRPPRRAMTCRSSAASGRWSARDSARCSTAHSRP